MPLRLWDILDYLAKKYTEPPHIRPGPLLPEVPPPPGLARKYQPRDRDEHQFLFLTLIREPGPDEMLILRCQDKIVPREKYQLLRNLDTNQLHIFWDDATWGDCCTAHASIVPNRGPL